MDPLSITASAIALMQAAGAVATALGSVVRSLRTVDSRVTVLCKELTDLTGFLEAIDGTLKGCQKFDLGLADDALWRQSELALANCQTTLNELALLVGKIRNSNRPTRFARKVRAAVDLSIYGNDLVMYRDRIHQSNSALQTMLHAINVSLSVRNNASHDLILRELDRLDASINEAFHTSSRPVGGFYNSRNGPSDARFGRNLRRLAEAAKHFHTAASSTAGTVRSDTSVASRQSYPGAEMSLFGDFSVSCRERVEEFINRQTATCRSPEPETRQPPRSTSMSNMFCAATTASNNVPEMPIRTSTIDEEEDDDAELERAFLDGLRELATASFKDRNYDKAITFLQEAMTRDIEPGESSHEYRQIQIKLALCYLCQGKCRLAAPLVIKLAKLKTRLDLAVCNLLHALALGYLSEYSFDDALVTCKQALHGKKKLCKSGDIEWNEYWETLGLYATIFDVTGDCIRAEVFRLKLPADFVYVHPSNEAFFIRFHTGLLQSIFGDDGIVYAHAGIAELDGGTGDGRDDQGQQLSRRLTVNNCFILRQKLSQDEKCQIDTAKEVVAIDSQSPNDADDETSPTSTPQESPLRRRLSRFFLARRRRPVDSEETLVNSPKAESPLSDSSPSTLSPTRLRWFKDDMGFPVKKRKNLLTKKPYKLASPCRYDVQGSKPNGAFRLLRMERVTTPTPDSELSRRFSWRSETCRPYMHTRDSNQESVHSVQSDAPREDFRGRHVPAVWPTSQMDTESEQRFPMISTHTNDVYMPRQLATALSPKAFFSEQNSTTPVFLRSRWWNLAIKAARSAVGSFVHPCESPPTSMYAIPQNPMFICMPRSWSPWR